MQSDTHPNQVVLSLPEERASKTIDVPAAPASSKRRVAIINVIPTYFWIALLVLAILETLSVVGSYYYIQGQANANQDAALNIARVSGRAIERLLDDQKGPIYEIVNYVKTMKGHYPSIKQGFYELAALISESYEIYEIELVPGGYISDMYLPWQTLTGDDLEQWNINNLDLYLNILWPNPKRPKYWGPLDADLYTINSNGSIFLSGPWIGEGVLSSGALVSRISVFLDDYGNWSLPPESKESTCPPSFCRLPDNRTLWGFVVCIFPYKTISEGLSAVKSAGLKYNLKSNYAQPYTNYPTILDSNYAITEGDKSVCTEVDVFRWLGWTLCVSQNGGWNPIWGPALYAGVTLLSLLISILVFFILRSRAKAVEFLSKQVTWNKELESEKEKLHTMMVRQYEIIQCFTLKKNSQLSAGIEDKIKAARDQLTQSGVAQMAEQDKIVLFKLLGQGSFGAVFLGEWRGTQVAVKRIILPPAMSVSNRAEKMAIMEVAISSSMSHPHLVQTYTYRVKPIEDKPDHLNSCIVVMGGGDGSTVAPGMDVAGSSLVSASSHDSSSVTSYELLLVLEYCDRGSLRSLLDVRGLEDENGSLNYAAALDICLDIAKAMIHLHRNNIMHLDLKAANVLLKTGSGGDKSLVAKVMDFGLSLSLDVETHVSSLVAGTTSHMSPEILMEGKQTKAADVYAFGITLWEVFTGSKAYKGIPQMVLGHKIVFEHLRPSFPVNAPSDFKLLAERCWHPDPNQRPSFDDVFDELKAMREHIDHDTLPLRKIDLGPTSPPVAFAPSQEAMLSVAQFAPLQLPRKESETESIIANSVAAAYKVTKGE